MKPSEYCALLYSTIPGEENAFKCKMCYKAIKQNKAAGTSNLETHLHSKKHKDQWKPYLEALRNPGHGHVVQRQKTLDYLRDDEVTNIFSWADLLTIGDSPLLSWASNERFLKAVTLKGVDKKTLKKYFVRVGLIFESNFGKRRKKDGSKLKYILFIDMWKNMDGDHCLGVFLGYPKEDEEEEVRKRRKELEKEEEEKEKEEEEEEEEEECSFFLLLCCPLRDADDVVTAEHMEETILTALQRMKLDWSDILLVKSSNNNACAAFAAHMKKPSFSPTFTEGLLKIKRYSIVQCMNSLILI